MILCYNANQRMPEKTDGALIKLAGGGWAEALILSEKTVYTYSKLHFKITL